MMVDAAFYVVYRKSHREGVLAASSFVSGPAQPVSAPGRVFCAVSGLQSQEPRTFWFYRRPSASTARAGTGKE